MKLYMSVGLLFTFLFSASCFSEGVLTEAEIVDRFVHHTNKEYESFFSIKKEDVLIDKNDIDKNGSADLMVYYDGRCGASRGCQMDVYLCVSTAPSCDTNKYCYAGVFYEGQVEKNNGSIKCI